MAYVTEQIINKARAAMKVLNKEYGIKATLSGKGTSSLKLTIASGSIDFIENFCAVAKDKNRMHDLQRVLDYIYADKYIQVNHYYLEESFSGKALEYLQKVKQIMYVDHWDESDVQTDYFHCAYYVSINIGRWNKPYQFTI